MGREKEVDLGESGMRWDCVQKPLQSWLALFWTVVSICNFTHRGCLEIVTGM